MYENLKYEIIGSLHPKQFLAYDKMSAAAHRKELCQPLDKAENHSFIPLHITIT